MKWLDKTWGQYCKIPTKDMVQEEIEIYEENESQEEMLEEQEMHEQDIRYEEPEEEEGPIASRTRSQVEQPISSRTRSQTMDVASIADIKCGNNIQEWLEDVAFVTGTMCDPNEPQTFQQAWWDPDKKAREKWHEAIRLEFNKMINMGVWREVDKLERNANKRLVGSKWVFKIKRNGVYRARLVAKGFSQIPGEDFTENFSPVINDVTFRIILT